MFIGYQNDTFRFLQDLKLNNNRVWFNNHKNKYEDFVRTPSLRLIHDFQEELETISPNFVAIPKKVGGSLMRIQRDVRFSKDKSPYKSNIGIHFRHILGKNIHAPGFYLHISPQNNHLGAGIWRPDSKTLKKIRIFIADNPHTWSTITSSFKDNKKRFGWRLVGSTLKRAPLGFDKNHPVIEDLKRIDFLLQKKINKEEIMKRDLPVLLRQAYKETSDFVEYLCFALSVDF